MGYRELLSGEGSYSPRKNTKTKTYSNNGETDFNKPKVDYVSLILGDNNNFYERQKENQVKWQKQEEEEKAQIENFKKISSQNQATTNSLNPLEVKSDTEAETKKETKKKKRNFGDVMHDFFIGGADEEGNDKFFKLFGAEVKNEAAVKTQKIEKEKQDKVSNYINQYGYLDKNASDDDKFNYYKNYFDTTGQSKSDEDIKKMLGFGGSITNSENRVISSAKNAMAPGFDTDYQELAKANSQYNGGKFGNVATNLLGNTIGMAMNPGYTFAPGQNSLNVTDDIAKNIANKTVKNKVGKEVTRLGVDGALGGALDTFKEGNADNLGKNMAEGAVGNVLLGGTMELLPNGFKSISNKLNTKDNLVEVSDDIAKSVEIDSPKVSNTANYKNPKLVNKPLEEVYKEYDEAIKAIQDYTGHYKLTDDEILNASDELGIDIFDIVDRMAKLEENKIDYGKIGEEARLKRVAGITDSNADITTIDGLTPNLFKNGSKDVGKLEVEAMKIGDSPRINDVLPKVSDEIATTKANDIINGSKFANDTVMKSDIADVELKNKIVENNITYDPISNKETLANAQAFIDKDFNKAMALVMDDSRKVDADTMAIGQDLMRRLQNEGRYDEAINILERLTREGTKAGQAIQALSMWRRMTPEGMLAFAQKQINKVNDDLPKGAKKVELTDDEMKSIMDGMKKVNELADGREKDIELAKVNKIIQNKIPSKFMDKVDSFRYINMLFNPKTLIKNAGGNIINTAMGNLRDVIATPIDKVVSNFTGERTVGLPNLKEQGKGIVNGVKTVADDYIKGIDTTGSVKEGTRANAFNEGTFLGGVERLLSAGLKMGDVPFYQAAYNNYLSNVMKLNNVDVPTTKMLEDAHQVGLEATFQQRTGLGDAISGLKKNKSKLVSTTSKSLLPFSQTPSAILDTATNYTPAGVLRGIYNLSQGNQRKGVNQLASGILGTAGIGAGYGLAESGVLTGDLSDDKEIRAIQTQTGQQPYALKAGDTYNSLEFAQPAVSPLMMGADISNGEKGVGNILKTGLKSLLGNSFLSNLSGTSQRIGQNGLESLPEEVASTYLSQLLPFSSLSSQVNKTIDNTKRDSYSSDFIEKQLKSAMAKYPGLSQMLPQSVDTVGEDKVYNEDQGLGTQIFNNFINPSTMSKFNPSEVEKNVLDMYEKTGEVAQAPAYHSGKITNKGKTYELTDEEMREYSKRMAQVLKYTPATTEDYIKAISKFREQYRKELINKHNLK